MQVEVQTNQPTQAYPAEHVVMQQSVEVSKPKVPFYFGIAYDYFVDRITNSYDAEEKEFVAKLADLYADREAVYTYPKKHHKHLMLNNLTAYALNRVFMDNVLSLGERYETLKNVNQVDEERYLKGVENLRISVVADTLLELILKVIANDLPQDEMEIAAGVLLNKLASENYERIHQVFLNRNIQKSNDAFLEQVFIAD